MFMTITIISVLRCPNFYNFMVVMLFSVSLTKYVQETT